MSEKRFGYGETDLFEWVEEDGEMISTKECVNKLNELSEEKEYFEKKKEYFLSKWSIVHAKNIQLRQEIKELKKENERLYKENEKVQEEIKELRIERDDWKSSTCSYMNKDSILSMDCQIVREALWELEKEIEFGSKREGLFFDLKEKFEKLNNHRIGVYE